MLKFKEILNGDGAMALVVEREETAIQPIVNAIIQDQLKRLSTLTFGKEIIYEGKGIIMEYSFKYAPDGRYRYSYDDPDRYRYCSININMADMDGWQKIGPMRLFEPIDIPNTEIDKVFIAGHINVTTTQSEIDGFVEYIRKIVTLRYNRFESLDWS